MASAPADPSAGPLPPRLNRTAAIDRLGANPDLYQQVLQMFRETLPGACTELQAHLLAGRRPDARRTAHSIKGSAGAVGADRLLHFAAAAEAALAGAPGPADTPAVEALLAEADAVLASIARG